MPDSITSYLQGIFLISITGTVTEALLSTTSKNSKTLESALKLVFSICLLLSVIVPGVKLLKNTDISQMLEIQTTSTLTQDELNIIELTKKQLENDVSEKIYEEFGIKPTDVIIEFVTEENANEINVDIKSVNVLLSKNDEQLSVTINNYACSLVGLNTVSDGEQENEN